MLFLYTCLGFIFLLAFHDRTLLKDLNKRIPYLTLAQKKAAYLLDSKFKWLPCIFIIYSPFLLCNVDPFYWFSKSYFFASYLFIYSMLFCGIGRIKLLNILNKVKHAARFSGLQVLVYTLFMLWFGLISHFVGFAFHFIVASIFLPLILTFYVKKST